MVYILFGNGMSKLRLFNRNQLKILALLMMFLDHFGQIILKNSIMMVAPYSAMSDTTSRMIFNIIEVFHLLGRIAFPIFCFFIVEGFSHTKDLKKYIKRLIFIAIISEIPYDLAFNSSLVSFSEQNVFFELSLGIIMLYYLKLTNSIFLKFLIALLVSFISYYLKLDGSYYGIGLIFIFYILKNKNIYRLIFSVTWAFLIGFCAFDLYFLVASFSLFLIELYNGKKGGSLKYFFYTFYPIHILVLYWIGKFLLIPLWS